MDDIPLFFTPSSHNSKEPALKVDFSSLYHEYEVLLEIEKDTTKTLIEYTAGVKYEGYALSGNKLISLQKLTQTFINKTEPDLIAEKISDLAGSIFQPLKIELNGKGEAVRIYDYEFIMKKWGSIKEELQKNYAGQLLSSYVENINQTLKSSELVFKKLKNDWFLSLFCVPLYTQYTNPSEKEQWQLPSVLKGGNINEYTVFKSLESLQDTQNPILVYVQGIDSFNKCSCIYTLDNTTKLIKNIEAVITEKEGYSIRAEVQCTKIHKKEKENSPILEKKKDFDEEAEWQKYQRKKKGFWGRLFDD